MFTKLTIAFSKDVFPFHKSLLPNQNRQNEQLLKKREGAAFSAQSLANKYHLTPWSRVIL
jgi:hypothetical protein